MTADHQPARVVYEDGCYLPFDGTQPQLSLNLIGSFHKTIDPVWFWALAA